MADMQTAKLEIDGHLRREEGERLRPYLCDAGQPTIGVGATSYLDGRKVKLSDPPITREQMNRMLSVEIDRYMAEVLEMVDGECTTNQLVALVICAYNVGLPALRGSSMIRLHRERDYVAASRAFRLWNKYRKTKDGPLIVHPVLDARRAREAALYLVPDDEAPHQGAPQAVEAESQLTKSPMARDGVIAAGSGAVIAVPTIADQLGQASGLVASVKGIAQQAADFVGVPPLLIVAGVLVYVGFNEIRWRRRQRQEGWA